MVLASESGLDGSRALREKGNVSTNVKSGEIWVVGADVVDDDWLVCEDIFVFGGHSTGGGEGWLCRRRGELGPRYCAVSRDATRLASVVPEISHP